MTDYHPDGSLAPRDIVARGIHQMMHETGAPCAYLDITHKPADWVRERFPHVVRQVPRGGDSTSRRSPFPSCRPRTTAAAASRWTASASRACGGCAPSGEVSCTGLHGANRLASTSLLECLVWGTRAGARRGAGNRGGRARATAPRSRSWRHESEPVDPALIAQDWLTIRQTMWNYVGLVRNRRRLDRAHEIMRELHLEIGRFYARAELSDALISLRNGVQTALAVLLAAIEARESRGCHYRVD